MTWNDLRPFLKQGVVLPWMPFYAKGGHINKKGLRNVVRIGNPEFGEIGE